MPCTKFYFVHEIKLKYDKARHLNLICTVDKINQMSNTFQIRKTLIRYNIPNHAHELTFTCNKGLPLLTSERTCGNLAESIESAAKKLDYGTIAYVFMPTHVHLLVYPKKEVCSISDFLKAVKQPVARKEITYLKWNDPDKLELMLSGWERPKYLFWLHGGGYDRNIINPEYLVNAINYIHNNPVRKGFVRDALAWKWSSAKDWLTEEKGPISVMKSFRG